MSRNPREGRIVAKHLLDETAEFRMPRLPRHSAPKTDEMEATQRLETGFSPRRPAPAPQAAADPR